MASTAPLKLKEAFSMLSVGVRPTSLTFATASMSSDRHVVVREPGPNGSGELLVLETSNPTAPSRRPIAADGALMHPTRALMALRMGVNLQLFDVAAKKRVKAVAMPETITFWRWISDTTLGIVTSVAVYHWSSDPADDQEPVRIFDRHSSMEGCQVISYVADRAEKWLGIVGITAAPDGTIAGRLQLYSVDKKLSQALEGHAAAFAYLALPSYEATLFVFASRVFKPDSEAVESRLRVIEVGGAGEFGKTSSDIYYPPEFSNDFPVAIQISTKFPTVVYMITKMGYVHMYDLETAKCVYMNRVSDTTIFATVPHTASGGVMGLNRKGQVLLMAVNPDSVVEYVRRKLGDEELAVGLASRNGFRGAESGFADKFEDAMEDELYSAAAVIAAESPGGFLRTAETISRFKALGMVEDGGPPAVLLYFQTCLDRGKLNMVESIELGRQLAVSKKVGLLEKWIREDKLEYSEELGDVVRGASPTIALALYIKASVHEKVMQCMIETGQTSKVALYAKKVGMKVTHRDLVDMAAKFSPQAALEIANNTGHALVLSDPARRAASLEEVSKMVDMFLSKGMLNEATAHAMDNLRDDDEAEGPVQTKILKACLVNAPQIADGILSQDIWHQFDSFGVAMLCERAGLFQHALEHYSDLSDVKRVITNTHVINPEFIINYFGTIRPEDQLEVLEELLKTNPRANIRLCVTVAAKFTDPMGGAKKVIPVFESVKKVPDALFYYLGAIVAFSDVPDVHNRFIEIAVQLGQYNDADRVTRESTFYDPEKIKNFLKEARPKDPRPLINVCDRFGFVDELVKYFIRYKQIPFIEGYVQRVNPLRCPVVVGALLDNDGMKERDLKKLILSVKNMVPVDELVKEVESRGKLKLIHEFLESRIADGATDVEVHTGVAKVYIDGNLNPQHFLETNPYYDSRAVGKYCARRDPFLAFVAFQRGQCDEELLQVTNDNSLFREQALYAVDRADADLWGKIFSEDNPFRRLVVDQVISTALPQSKRPEKVSAAVRAFLAAGMPDVLMEMLEKLVMQTSNTAFARNTNLQNLLLLTAIGAAPERVMEYVRRLDNYDGPEVAPSCIGAGLFEEAYTIYYKFDKFDDALDVLLEHIKDFDRAEEFAIRMDRVDVWLKLGIAQLENGLVADGIKSLVRARDVTQYALVVDASRDSAESNDDFKMVAKFMRIARKKIREPESARRAIDTELVYALCRLNALTDVEEFIITPGHKADLELVGDRCFDIELYQAAKMMFRAVSCWPKLAHTHIMLHEYKEAVYAAKKANRIPTWRIVCFGCVDAEEFAFAAVCAIRLVVEVEEMEEVVDYYEERGHFQQIIDVLESALNSDRAHTAMFTEMAILLTKYREMQVLNFCRMWHGKFNVPKVSRACERANLWDSLVFLCMQYNEYDNAANVMMDHSPVAFTPGEFLDVISRVGAMTVMYRSVDFYLGEQPELLEDLLNVLAPRIDGARAVSMLQRARTADFGELGCLPFAVRYLEKIQAADVPEVNDALNSIYVTEQNVVSLRRSVDTFRNFDQLTLASRLENHKLLEFRRIASHVYARSGRHEQAIDIAKKDTLYADMIYAIAQSEDEELAEQYAAYFAENHLRECFSALLFACFNFFAPDVAMEYAWIGGLRDFAMPFLIQTIAEAGTRLTGLEEERREKREVQEMRREEEEEDLVDPSVLLYGLMPQQQQLMLEYHQAGGGVVGGAGAGGAGVGSNTPMIGWNQPNPMAAYSTYAVPQIAAAPQQAYMTNAQQQTYGANAQQQAYMTNAQQQAYITNAQQQAYVAQQAYMTNAQR